MISRRTLLAGATLLPGLGRLSGAPKGLKIGVTDWNLRLGANPDAVPLAASLGFDGVQVSFGRKIVDNRMPLDSPEVIDRYLQLSAHHRMPLDGTCVDMLHSNGWRSLPKYWASYFIVAKE